MNHLLNYALFEATGWAKDETEIIYRDKSLLVMIPKSHRASVAYGRGTNWCQADARNDCGFGISTGLGLLVRFLFKDGYKMRFTYETTKEARGQYHWGHDSGAHVLKGRGNPLLAQSERRRESGMEQEILARIATLPDAATQAVTDFLAQHGETPYPYDRERTDFAANATQSATAQQLTEWFAEYDGINTTKTQPGHTQPQIHDLRLSYDFTFPYQDKSVSTYLNFRINRQGYATMSSNYVKGIVRSYDELRDLLDRVQRGKPSTDA